jgi:hypothetical protein
MEEYDYDQEDSDQEELELDETEEESLDKLEDMELVGDVDSRNHDEAPSEVAQTGPVEPPNIVDHAAKVYTIEIASGEFVRGTGSQRSFLRMWNGEDVDRARVMGTVVQRFLSNDGTYSALTLDDGTETVRVKGWREDAAMMSSFDVGQVLDVIGHVREYDGEIYLSPITINGIGDPNWEPMRELEIYSLRKVKKNDLQL